jgi:hypothetical protein
MSFDSNTYRKSMTVAKLVALLQTLPQDALVEANLVGNLLVTDASDAELAYVDFSGEFVESLT